MDLLIKNKSTEALSLNESVDENGNKKYIYEGVFTPLDGKKNRNGRIYDKDVVLPHIAALRKQIQENGMILGEINHPVDRFETSLTEVSHKITDLYYSPDRNAVIGKLELLDTKNGKIAKALADAGYPIFVSSRAAGTVGPDSHVSIQQIFTYDIVATPGFAEARLDKVDESMRPAVTAYLNESLTAQKNTVNKASKYGILDENISIADDIKLPVLNEGVNNISDINIKELEKPLSMVKEDVQVKVTLEKAKELGLTGNEQHESDNDKSVEKPSKEDILNIIPEYSGQGSSEINDIQPEFDTSENSKGQVTGQANNGLSESKKITVNYKIDYSSSDDISEDDDVIDSDSGNDMNVTNEKAIKAKKKEIKYSKKKDLAEDDIDIDSNAEISETCIKDRKKALKECDKVIDDLKRRKKEIKESADYIINDVDSYLSEQTKINQVKESIFRKYPFAISLSPDNFNKFTQLIDEDKQACADYIWEHQIYDIKQINEQWSKPLIKSKNSEKNYLKLADDSDRQLYENAPEEVKNAIDEMANLYILESKSDVDEFWNRTGLRMSEQNRINKENFINEYNEAMKMNDDNTLADGGIKIIDMVEKFMK